MKRLILATIVFVTLSTSVEGAFFRFPMIRMAIAIRRTDRQDGRGHIQRASSRRHPRAWAYRNGRAYYRDGGR